MLRELLKKRSELVGRAQALVEKADSENRDLTEEERAEFARLLGEGDAIGEVGALDVQIERIEGERTRLRAAVEKKFTSGTEPVKPDGKSNDANKAMKRAEFDKLDPNTQLAYIKAGGKLED